MYVLSFLGRVGCLLELLFAWGRPDRRVKCGPLVIEDHKYSMGFKEKRCMPSFNYLQSWRGTKQIYNCSTLCVCVCV